MIFLGIDTSCYTTSVAAVDEEGNLVSQQRRLLSVAEGERGLRQSEAFFKHVNNFPELYKALLERVNPVNIAAVCVSTQPRGLSHSYMPVFFAGRRIAENIAMSLNVPLFATDHQQGHIQAALYGTDLSENSFCAVHLSGGTTEVLSVQKQASEWKIKQLAASKDINAGQLIDRLGVKMGMSFPAGKEVDKRACAFDGVRLTLPISASMEDCSFSGTEAAALRALEGGADPDALCEALMSAIARTLAKMAGGAAYYAGLRTVLMAGGVSSSAYLRQKLPVLFEQNGSACVVFSQPELSADNAVGVALLGRMKFLHKGMNE
ncbi:MAG: O-sialoglycoprotein endopeptidase [Clostridia bacterium]|nr:O-sialoglycoprotein endopeptidase [Clostridia bacterium]